MNVSDDMAWSNNIPMNVSDDVAWSNNVPMNVSDDVAWSNNVPMNVSDDVAWMEPRLRMAMTCSVNSGGMELAYGRMSSRIRYTTCRAEIKHCITMYGILVSI